MIFLLFATANLFARLRLAPTYASYHDEGFSFPLSAELFF